MVSTRSDPIPPTGPRAHPLSVWSSRARIVFSEVNGLDGAARREALDRACGEDWALHAEVAALLAHDVHPSLHAGARPRDLSGTGSTIPTDLPHDAIPGFHIVRLLGVGAVGAVYEAEQESPRRPVALKVFRSPGADERLRHRIAHEAEVLGRLAHPNVAQVFAVHTEAGDLPWIAMELVDGTPIDAWCRARETSVRARVELLATVAEAVGHAHACGVVHRDLKPSNVLVTAAAGVKVVDFGVARTVGDAPFVGTLHTQDGDIVGTLAYMSVEQAEGDSAHVDTRTDVHALGTLGFELLAARLPRDPTGMTLPEWAQALRRPAPALRDVVPGTPTDLSLVLAKALEPDRARRYPTAQALADDLRRFLRAEPIVARAPTGGYLLRSFVRRHRALVLGALATLLALVAGLVVSLRFALESQAQQRRADREAADSRRGTYRAQMSVASQALSMANAFGARAALERAPEAFRGWEWTYLASQIDRSIRTVRFPVRFTRIFDVAPDATRVIAITAEGDAVVVDAGSGRFLMRIPGGTLAERLAFLSDGRRIAVARPGGVVDVLDAGSGALVRSFPPEAGRTSVCDALAVAPHGAGLVESRRDRTPRLRFLDADAGTTSLRDVADTNVWTALRYSPDGTRLVATTGDGRVVVGPAIDAGPFVAVGRHVGVALDAALDPSGGRCVSAGIDRCAVLVDVLAPTRRGEFLHQQQVNGVAWSGDGARIATWAEERVLRIFEADGFRLALEVPALDADERAVLRFAPGDAEIRAFEVSGTHTWFATRDQSLDVLRGHRTLAEGNSYPYVYDVDFSPDGRRIATAAWDGSVRVSSVATCRTVAVLETDGPLQALAFAPDGRSLVAVGRPNDMTSFDTGTGRRLAVVKDGIREMSGGLAFTRDGAAIVAPSDLATVVLRDPHTLRRTRILSEGRATMSVATGPDGAIVLGNMDGSWERRPGVAGERTVPFQRHARSVARVAVSADGRLVASGSDDGLARVADALTGATRCELGGHVGKVYALAFSPDGRRLATGGDDGTVRLHDTATGDELLVLRGHASYVFSLKFSPDGMTLASASGDNTVRLWSLRPIAERVARRERALAAEATVEPLVCAALAGASTPEAAVEGLRTRTDLDEEHRAAALDVALRLLAGPKDAATPR